MSGGEIWRVRPVPTSTVVRRCSYTFPPITPAGGVMGSRGPGTRGAFSVKSSASVLPSGDHPGASNEPIRSVSLRTVPPLTLATYNCTWPRVGAVERKASSRLWGDQAISCPSQASPLPAVMRRTEELGVDRLVMKMAELDDGDP